MHCVLLYHLNIFLKGGNIFVKGYSIHLYAFKERYFSVVAKQINLVIIPFKLQ